MFFAAGVGAYGAAMFHLFTHAAFKALAVPRRGQRDPRHAPRAGHALLRRAAQGDPVHLLGDDDRHAGDHRRRHHPGDGLAALGFAGFFSKDAIIESAYASGATFGGFAFFVGVFAALLTSFYSLAADLPDLLRQAALGGVRAYPARAARRSSRSSRRRGCRPRHPRRTRRARRRSRPAPAAIIRTKAPGRSWCRSACCRSARSLAGQVFHDAFIEPEDGRAFLGAAASPSTRISRTRCTTCRSG